MANLKRRPDKDLNHDNWDQDDAAEEKGEFKKAAEDDLRARRMLVPRRKIIPSGSGGAASSVSSNPFSAFAFGAPAAAAAPIFGIPANPSSSTNAIGDGGTGSLFKLVGITPSSEPPTKASADSSTADTPGGSEASASGIRTERQQESEPEVGSISESEGITEESSNSSSLPWNVSSRQQEKEAAEERAGADSMQNLKVRPDNFDKDLNNDNWVDDDDPEENGDLASNEAMQARKVLTPNRKIAQTATAPADSSESSSASNPNPSNNPFSAFSFGNTFGSGTASGSLFRPFASASATVSQSAESAVASTVPTSTASVAPPEQSQPQASGDTRSPESSGILVRSSIEEDSADYENDTTSSSNKLLMSENEVSNDDQQESVVTDHNNEDREAEAEANEEREAEGVDS